MCKMGVEQLPQLVMIDSAQSFPIKTTLESVAASIYLRCSRELYLGLYTMRVPQ